MFKKENKAKPQALEDRLEGLKKNVGKIIMVYSVEMLDSVEDGSPKIEIGVLMYPPSKEHLYIGAYGKDNRIKSFYIVFFDKTMNCSDYSFGSKANKTRSAVGLITNENKKTIYENPEILKMLDQYDLRQVRPKDLTKLERII